MYILTRNNTHAVDITVKTTLDSSLKHCDIDLLVPGISNVRYELLDADGNTALQGLFDFSAKAELQNPKLWDAENPYLYTLLLSCCGEVIPFKIGVKRVEIKDKKLLINGKREILRGVNRHDSDAFTGYYVSPENMERDIFVIKRANVNTIRTSHYPNGPRFYELCSKYGIYTVDEADLETHGMGFDYEGESRTVDMHIKTLLPFKFTGLERGIC